jgi:hypothetical protein
MSIVVEYCIHHNYRSTLKQIKTPKIKHHLTVTHNIHLNQSNYKKSAKCSFVSVYLHSIEENRKQKSASFKLTISRIPSMPNTRFLNSNILLHTHHRYNYNTINNHNNQNHKTSTQNQ